MSTAGEPIVTGEKPLTEVERVVDTFVAPSKTFTDIKRNASWWVPWLLMSVFGMAMVFTVEKKLTMETAYENQLRLSPKQMDKIDQLPPDQKANAIKLGGNITRYFSYGSPLLTIVFIGIIAGVLMATFNFGFGAEVKFMQAMAISMYAFLPIDPQIAHCDQSWSRWGRRKDLLSKTRWPAIWADWWIRTRRTFSIRCSLQSTSSRYGR